MIERRGLDESLEAYAARIGRTPDEARALWRLQGLYALHAIDRDPYALADLVTRGHARIAPGVSVPTAHVTWSDEP